ncbi:MAG: hypothetical protein M0P97_01635 [Candidatus Moranbacteria bacterium]|jgi:hypothetical protein|nr:hypothetical protein [Candidatus Moranbacteria bacterium]
MNKKQINTKLAAIIIVVFLITASVFVWKYEDIRYKISSQNNQQNIVPQIENNQEELNKNQEIPEAIEYPTIAIEPGVSLEEIIRQAIFKKFPNWKVKNYSVTTTVETNEKDHAIGRFIYDGYNITRDGKYHNTADGIWFAAKSDNAWTLVTTSYTGYWGSCQDFKKYKFPSDMIPDCWDTEKKILIDTLNQGRFYPKNFTKKDKQELIQAYIEYGKKNLPEGFGCKGSKCDKYNLYSYVRLDKSINNYLRGTFFGNGGENIGFYAIKQSDKWIVVYSGQDSPSCSLTDPYNFPEVIVKCK